MQTETATTHRSRRGWVAAALAITAIVVVAAAFLASGDPDGLERVAEDTGFLTVGQDSPFAIIADYVFPGLEGPIATIVAGLVGVAVVFALVWVFGRAVARRRS